MRSYDGSEVCFQSFLANLNKTELKEHIEICLKGRDDSIFEKQNYWKLVRNTIVLDHNWRNGKAFVRIRLQDFKCAWIH